MAAPQPNNILVKFRGKPKKLPKHAKKLAKRGMISERQMEKMKGEAK